MKTVVSGLLLAACAMVAVPVQAAQPELSMLDRLERGNWELRERGGEGRSRNICLQNPRSLIQLQHEGVNCQRVIVHDDATQVTVQYTCQGHGYGRTQIRRETNRLMQFDTQGIRNGVPFSFAGEARRTGPCKR